MWPAALLLHAGAPAVMWLGTRSAWYESCCLLCVPAVAPIASCRCGGVRRVGSVQGELVVFLCSAVQASCWSGSCL